VQRVPQRAWDTGTPLDCLGRHLDGMVVSTICTLYAKTAAPRTCITPRAQLARLLRSLFAVISVTGLGTIGSDGIGVGGYNVLSRPPVSPA